MGVRIEPTRHVAVHGSARPRPWRKRIRYPCAGNIGSCTTPTPTPPHHTHTYICDRKQWLAQTDARDLWGGRGREKGKGSARTHHGQGLLRFEGMTRRLWFQRRDRFQ